MNIDLATAVGDYPDEALDIVGEAWRPLYHDPSATGKAQELVETVEEVADAYDIPRDERAEFAMASYVRVMGEESDLDAISSRIEGLW